jgi:hypothetical protein
MNGFTYQEMREMNFKTSKNLWKSCLNTVERKKGKYSKLLKIFVLFIIQLFKKKCIHCVSKKILSTKTLIFEIF